MDSQSIYKRGSNAVLPYDMVNMSINSLAMFAVTSYSENLIFSGLVIACSILSLANLLSTLQ